VHHFTMLIESTSGLEYIGLAKNQLGKWSDVKDWLDNIGKFPMTNEEVEEYRLKEKEREAAVQKNQKVNFVKEKRVLIRNRIEVKKVMLKNLWFSYIQLHRLVMEVNINLFK